MFKNNAEHIARSAGTSSKARIRVNESLLKWADVILVMEYKHKYVLTQHFAESISGKTITVLHIPDVYTFNDPELVSLLKDELAEYL